MNPVLCCDLDGVIWRGDEAIAGSAEAVARLRAAGIRVAFLTNNSSRPVAEIVEQLGSMGIPSAADDVLTSGQAAARLLTQRIAPGSRVLACAGPGVVEALTARGFTVVDAGPADAVVVGWHRSFDFDGLDRASAAVRAGARFVATNTDPTYPGRDHLLPGAGAIVAAIATASGASPEVAGKPERPTVELVRERLGSLGIVVGDRPSTDGALAAALGWPFALVLSGVTAAEAPPGGEAIPEPRPPFVGDDLAAIAEQLRDALLHGS
ncbi:MAG: HAD-IIA family hydrolase [Actinobacteria bacterium]|nr:HAD-IIA family hydrolase [Actinomycetota bacterium]